MATEFAALFANSFKIFFSPTEEKSLSGAGAFLTVMAAPYTMSAPLRGAFSDLLACSQDFS